VRIKFLSALCLASISLIACDSSSQPTNNSLKRNLSDRERDGLVGPVKAVLTDDVIMGEQNGQQIETQQASSTSTYDESGKRTTQTPFRIALPGGYAITQHDPMFNPQARTQRTEEPISNQGGKWLKNYDDKGYVTESVRYDAGGKQAERLSVSYEFDDRGDWIKRIIRRSNQDSPQLTEVSYRRIIYFGSPTAPGDGLGEFISASANQLKSPLPSNEDNLARGQVLFNQKCAACHGENGKSQTPFAAVMPTKPEDLTGEQVRALGEGAIYSVISNGLRSSGMPAFKGRVSDEALWQISLYVRQLPGNQSVPGPANGKNIIASSSPKPAQPRRALQADRQYQIKGKVISVERESRQVTIEHEEIKGYMGAMTMPFPLNDEKALGRIKKDDRIEATLVVGVSGWRLENVVIK